MPRNLHHARIAGSIQYQAGGASQEMPRGPCLLERIDDRHVDFIWGGSGEHSATVLIADARRAADQGDLVLLE